VRVLLVSSHLDASHQALPKSDSLYANQANIIFVYTSTEPFRFSFLGLY
jgi:hypothetical protein